MLPFNSIINEIIRSEIDIIYNTNAFGSIIMNKNYTISFVTIFLRLLYALLSHIHFVAGPFSVLTLLPAYNGQAFERMFGLFVSVLTLRIF